MPNWCNNTIEIRGEPAKMREFVEFLEKNSGKDWFDFFHPVPESEKDNWYSWSVENWGCKWNCDAQDWSLDESDEEEFCVSFWFDSPWGPPLELYDKMYADDIRVWSTFHEEGMGFVGGYDDGFRETYEYSDSESLDDVPEHLIEEWNLRELVEDRENDEDDE